MSPPTTEVLADADEREAGERNAVHQLGDEEAASPEADVDLRRRQRQEAACLVEQNHLGADDDHEPHDRIEHGRPEHGGDREERIERRHGDGGAELAAREHRQQLVLELRLEARAGGQARARRLEVGGGALSRVAQTAKPRNLLADGTAVHFVRRQSSPGGRGGNRNPSP